VPKPEIHAFTDEFLDEASALLAARHRRHRAAEPLLPVAYEQPEAARTAIEGLLGPGEADGVAATRDGRVVGYLLGIRKSDDLWGANAWVEPAGHAAEQAEDVRDLYAAAAACWVEAGRKAHYAVVPAGDDDLVAAWFRVGFGQQHAYGIREVPDVYWPDGVRRAEERDIEALIVLDPELSEHQRRSPVFSGQPTAGDDPGALRSEILEDIDSPTIGALVAERDGRVVGNLIVCPLELSETMHYGLARPEHMSFIGFAVTDPKVRGSGVGLSLAQAAFAWSREHGYDAIVTDWRVTNLLASRFWTSCAFRPTFLRLHRLIA
jgi:GNAT superfamily N-acetyltransferase